MDQGPVHRRIRSIFVSDVHLGCKHSRAAEFLKFLRLHRPERLYLVGDFVDGRKLCRKWRWHAVYNRILDRLLELADEGTQVFYTPGNHDEFLRGFGWNFGPVAVADEFVHVTPDRRRFLVTHGDLFDKVECEMPWLSKLASIGYDFLLSANWFVNWLRGGDKRSQYAFSAAVKSRVKQVVRFISDFELRLIRHARQRNCQGIICGHIHSPKITQLGRVTYCNTGDWVEHCTALLEYTDGELELIYFDGNEPAVSSVPASHLLARPRNRLAFCEQPALPVALFDAGL